MLALSDALVTPDRHQFLRRALAERQTLHHRRELAVVEAFRPVDASR